jgi:hypothetical protein
MASMAAAPCSSVSISTNAKPRLRPVSRSMTTLEEATVPNWEKASDKCSDVTE